MKKNSYNGWCKLKTGRSGIEYTVSELGSGAQQSIKNRLQTHVGFVVVDHKVVDNEMNR